MSFPWPQLKFWESGECQVLMERLDDLQRTGVPYTPARRNVFRALSSISYEDVRVLVVGQDPYPNMGHATGIAFDTPVEAKVPPTLANIFKEYHDDLGLPEPATGSLEKWYTGGVLLWNAVPVCVNRNVSIAHAWPEWRLLTEEIVRECSQRAIPCAFLGSIAREFTSFVAPVSKVLEFAHPSPRASLNAKTPFNGSRMFRRINAACCELGVEPINWRLT